MGLEAVTKIVDLNVLWPLGTDKRHEGDNHLRAVKTAVVSLLTDLQQIRFDTVEANLTVASTLITWTGTVVRGCRVAVIIKQDATGGRLITWDTMFKLVSTGDISLEPNSHSVFEFVGDSAGKLVLAAVPQIGRTA